MKRRRSRILWLLPFLLPLLLPSCGLLRDEFWSLDETPPDLEQVSEDMRGQ